MWTNVVTGLFTLAGLITGVLLEPLKGLFAARVRNRQQRAEQAVHVISAATEAKHAAVELNGAFRTRTARIAVDRDQELALIKTYNRARDDLRKAVGLIRLRGPDVLADEAERLMEADEALFRLCRSPMRASTSL
jgi:hypothetical protein